MNATATLAIAGDLHGRHRQLYEHILAWEREAGRRVDLVLQLGDYQSLRDARDLALMPAPPQYRDIGDFPFYAAGVPRPTLFVGGNHEAYGWLEDLPHGGEIVPNLHYLGRSGVVQRFGLRIGGVTGIHAPTRFDLPRPPVGEWSRMGARALKLPTYYNRDDLEALRAAAPIDLLLLHDWPSGLARDVVPLHPEQASAARRFAAAGSPVLRSLVLELAPRWVFCGHMHVHLRARLQARARDIDVTCLDQVGGPQTWILFCAWNGDDLVRLPPDAGA